MLRRWSYADWILVVRLTPGWCRVVRPIHTVTLGRACRSRRGHMGTSDTELADLIACRKSITDPPRTDMSQDGAHRRNDFKCQDVGADVRFRVFMRQNVAFPENFSIGLVH